MCGSASGSLFQAWANGECVRVHDQLAQFSI